MDDICKIALNIGNESIYDDLEGFISDLRKNSLRTDSKWLHFLPKLAEIGPISENSKRQYRDFVFMKKNPDVPEEEMALSESKSKYCYALGSRKTIIFENYEKVVPNWRRAGQKRKIKEYSRRSDSISKWDIP